MAELAMLTDR